MPNNEDENYQPHAFLYEGETVYPGHQIIRTSGSSEDEVERLIQEARRFANQGKEVVEVVPDLLTALADALSEFAQVGTYKERDVLVNPAVSALRVTPIETIRKHIRDRRNWKGIEDDD